MKQFEFQFDSIGCMDNTVKRITVLALAPDKLDGNTGAMLFCHGWGPNRFQLLEQMQATVDKYNLFCIAPEYRMSGYDYDPVGGSGWYRPYDFSFYQTFDSLLALRFTLGLHPELNRRRIFAYGGSQGGHMVLLCGVYAPSTFAAIYSSSALTCVSEDNWHVVSYGRDFSDSEKKVRSIPYLIDRFDTPLFMEHGTADDNVNHALHTAVVERMMKERGKPCEVVYYEGGGHALTPAITKIDAYNAMAQKFLGTYENSRTDDFAAGSRICIPCGERTLKIDWSRDVRDPELMVWK